MNEPAGKIEKERINKDFDCRVGGYYFRLDKLAVHKYGWVPKDTLDCTCEQRHEGKCVYD